MASAAGQPLPLSSTLCSCASLGTGDGCHSMAGVASTGAFWNACCQPICSSMRRASCFEPPGSWCRPAIWSSSTDAYAWGWHAQGCSMAEVCFAGCLGCRTGKVSVALSCTGTCSLEAGLGLMTGRHVQMLVLTEGRHGAPSCGSRGARTESC